MMLFLSFVLLEGAGGRAGEPPRSPGALRRRGAALARTLWAVTSLGELRKAGEENALKLIPPCEAALSLCAAPRAGLAPGGPSAAAPVPPKSGRWKRPFGSSLRTAHDKLLLKCYRSVYLVTTMSNMM